MRDDSAGTFDQVMRMTQESSAAMRRYATADLYDFKATEKFSQDQNKFLERIFYKFSEQSITLLAPLLQSRVDMELNSVRQQPYQKYINSLPDPTTLVVFKIEGDARAILSLEYELSFGLLDKLMGGRGVAIDEVRYFTDLEKAVLHRPIVRLLEAYAEAWREVREFHPQFSVLEFNPLAVHISPPNETMVVVTFHCNIAQSHGMLELCLPFKHLKPTIPKASFDEYLIQRQAPAAAPAVSPVFAKNLEAARVPVSVELGRAEVMFQDLLSLEVGDTIKLDSVIGEPLRIRINERTKFLGHPGTTRDGKMAAKLIRVLAEGDEEFEE